MNRRVYSTLLIVIALAVAGLFVYSARAELVEAISAASPLFLALLYLATLVQNLTLWLVFHVSSGAGNAFSKTCRMHFGGQVAKYVPGKIWALVYQATLKSDSMPMGNIVQGNIVIYALSVISVVSMSLTLIVQAWSVPAALIVLAVGGGLSVYFMSSDHLYRIIQRFSRLSARFELTAVVPATDFSMVTRVSAYVVLLLSCLLSNVFLLHAFFDLELFEVMRLSAYLGIAWLAGVIVAISPSGLGVREAVFVGIGYVADANSFELFASIAIVARAIQILQDLVSAFLVPAIVGLVYEEDEARA
ncbi:MAG: hypothetical protein CL933_02070 [Deltaproteobacteria bacterium]|nr:hypothetical protein [Deltaproteobacteria bacterium]